LTCARAVLATSIRNKAALTTVFIGLLPRIVITARLVHACQQNFNSLF
jgi:hypothetical protein